MFGKKSWRASFEDFFAGVTTNDFEYHMNQVPFSWTYFDKEIKMLFVGGFMGVRFDSFDQSQAM
jgi:hypothetical protein